MTTIPGCAARCPLVTTLVIERARDRGTSEQHERITHGLPGEDQAPVYACTECGHEYPSRLAARECADFDLEP